jgi:uncharacterized protein DUF6788
MLNSEEIRARVQQRLREQRLLVRDLLRRREQLGGSLFARYGVCGKENCVCRTGPRHGPYYVLSTRSTGKGGFSYLEGRRAEEARNLVKRHQEFKAGLRRLRRVNAELMALLRRYQQLMARRGGRRMGLAAPRVTS